MRLDAWRSALAQRDFRLLFTGQLLSLLGDWSNNVALLVLTYQITQNPAATGAIFALKTAPRLLFLPFGGWAADRVDRRRLMIAMDLIRTPLALLPLLAHDVPTLGLMWASVLGMQICASFFAPSRVPLTAALFADRPERLPAANALLALTNQLALTAGPALGAVVLLQWGPSAVFVLNALTFVISALLLTAMRAGDAHGRVTAGVGLAAVGAGARIVLHGERLRFLALGTGVSGGLVFLFQANIPHLASALDDVSRASGLMLTSVGLGTVIGAQASVALARRESAPRNGLIVGLCAIVLAAAAPTLPLVLLFLFINGVGGIVADLGFTRRVQELPSELQGRAIAFYLVIVSLGQLCGALVAGALGGLSVATAEVVLAVALLLVALIVTALTTRTWRPATAAPSS